MKLRVQLTTPAARLLPLALDAELVDLVEDAGVVALEQLLRHLEAECLIRHARKDLRDDVLLRDALVLMLQVPCHDVLQLRTPEKAQLPRRIDPRIRLRAAQDIEIRAPLDLLDGDDAPARRHMLLDVHRVPRADDDDVHVEVAVVVLDLPREPRVGIGIRLDLDSHEAVRRHHDDIRAAPAHILFLDDPDAPPALLQESKQRLTDVPVL